MDITLSNTNKNTTKDPTNMNMTSKTNFL